MAVIVAVPLPMPVASPAALMVATEALLEFHATWPVRLTVDPAALAPMAMNWLACFGSATDCEPGIRLNDTMSLLGDTLPPVTLTVAVAEMAPAILAVMVAVPAETAVAM